jgi:hypothetical protein
VDATVANQYVHIISDFATFSSIIFIDLATSVSRICEKIRLSHVREQSILSRKAEKNRVANPSHRSFSYFSAPVHALNGKIITYLTYN